MWKFKPFPQPLGILGDYCPLTYYSPGFNIMQAVSPFPPLSDCKWNSAPSPVSTKESTPTGISSDCTEGFGLARAGGGVTQLFSSLQKPLSYFSVFSLFKHVFRLFLRNYKYFPSSYAEKFSSSVLDPNFEIQIHQYFSRTKSLPMASSEDKVINKNKKFSIIF